MLPCHPIGRAMYTNALGDNAMPTPRVCIVYITSTLTASRLSSVHRPISCTDTCLSLALGSGGEGYDIWQRVSRTSYPMKLWESRESVRVSSVVPPATQLGTHSLAHAWTPTCALAFYWGRPCSTDALSCVSRRCTCSNKAGSTAVTPVFALSKSCSSYGSVVKLKNCG
jgi:hypothetical protein